MNIEEYYLARDRKRVELWRARLATETGRINAIIHQNSNTWGDFQGSTELLVAHSRTSGIRVQILDGFNYYNKPEKHVDYRTTKRYIECKQKLAEATKRADANARKRSAYKKALAAKKAALPPDHLTGGHVQALRRRASTCDHAKLLSSLLDAQRASDRAKSRAADGVRFHDYMQCTYNATASNYRRSRRARWRDYEEKSTALQEAVTAAEAVDLIFGCQRTEPESYIGYVLYFDLPAAGQVSFHSESPLTDQLYPGAWDGSHQTEERIRLAIRHYLKGMN